MKKTAIATAFLSLAMLAASVAGAQERPNLVVVLSDDLSEDLLAATLDLGLAPNIQQYLVNGGVKFDNSFVSNALCCPSRVTLLRGQYTHNHRVYHNRRTGFDAGNYPGIAWEGWLPNGADPGRESSTVATWLQASGYRTGHVGRYLNGYGVCGPDGVCLLGTELEPGQPDPRLHVPAGYDEWHGLVDPGTFKVFDYELNYNGTLIAFGNAEAEYQTDVLADRAAGFIDDSVAGGTPFLLFVDTFAPHVEPIPDDLLMSRFEPVIRPAPRHAYLVDGDLANGELPGPLIKPSFNEPDMSDKPTCLPMSPPAATHQCPADIPPMVIPDEAVMMIDQYKSMMASMMAVDDLVGTVMDRLIANGVDNDTVVIFTSDNGWMYGEHRASGKEVVYEESIRVPLLIRGPGIPAGVVASQTVINNDLAATLVDYADVVPPYQLDGTSLVSLLADPVNHLWHRKVFLVEHYYVPDSGYAKYAALRYRDTSRDLVFSTTFANLSNTQAPTHVEFYDLLTDPYQMQSLVPPPGAPFGTLLGLLQSCAGIQCRFLESLSIP